MNPAQMKLARHALGLPNDRQTSYRNRYYAGHGTPQEGDWNDLVSRGLAVRLGRSLSTTMYILTADGALRSISAVERLDREDFPGVTAAKRARS